MSDDTEGFNWGDAEGHHEALNSDDRPRSLRRLCLTWEQYDDACADRAADLYVYDPTTGQWG